jgi:hypothetical protein
MNIFIQNTVEESPHIFKLHAYAPLPQIILLYIFAFVEQYYDIMLVNAPLKMRGLEELSHLHSF